jgi:ComF family protein
LVTGLKFHARMNHARLLGELLAQALERIEDPLPELVVPVPLHPARQRQRGFNQALEIARIPARRLGIRLADDRVLRRLPTSPQSGLDATARRRNIRGAFAVRGDIDARHVALLDDVVTTGSTAAELARALTRAGAMHVDVWAVARTE